MLEMTIQKVVDYSAMQGAVGNNETFDELFLARELLFLRPVAVGANLSMLAVLFDELRVSLLDIAKAKVKVE
jgi:hypothetical protein